MFQKLFSMFFAYIIGFQLVVGAIPHHALNSSAWADTCSSGLQWNEMLGRCVTTAQASQLADASKMCESQGDEAAKRQCYRDVIDGKMKDEGVAGPGKISSSMMSIILAMASLVAGGMFLAMNSGDCPGATSAYLIAGSAVAVIAGEIMSASKYKSAVKKAEEKFKAVTDSAKKDSDSKTSSDNSTATSAQAEAFQAMIEMEEATISAAKTKNMLYMVATAGYAAATVMAGIETVRFFIPPGSEQAVLTCYGSAANFNSPHLNKDLPSSYANLKDHNPIENSVAGSFIDNYFKKNQRVSFQSYLNVSSISTAEDSIELAFLNRELVELRGGRNISSSSTQDYFETRMWAKPLYQTESKEDFNLMKYASVVAQQFALPKAHAADPISAFAMMMKGVTGTAGGSTMTVTQGFTLKKLFLNPMTRLALAGIMTVNNIFMIKKTNAEKKKAEERKAFIEKLKAQVEAAGEAFGCANNDRNNLAKPNCYCYSEGGGLNPARVNSTTCKNLFGAKPTLASGKAGNPTDISNQKNCVTSKGALDSSCSCRTSNTCATVSTPRVIGNVPSGNILGNLPGTINGLNNGTLSAADINGAEFGALAARLNNMNEKLVNDPKNKNLALQTKKAKALADKTMKDMERSIASNPGALASNSGSGGFMNATSPEAALEAMKNDISQQIKGYEGNVVPVAGGTAGRKTDDFSLDALSGTGGVTVSDEQLAEAMNSQYDMGNSDINTDSGANIFSILSSRYQRSGMRRLFGGEALVPADKPASTEISR